MADFECSDSSPSTIRQRSFASDYFCLLWLLLFGSFILIGRQEVPPRRDYGLKRAKTCFRKIQQYAEHAPVNQGHRVLILEEEIALTKGKIGKRED